MYKLFKDPEGKISSIQKGTSTWIPMVLDNTDYQNFKKQINADEAQLEDADGNVMTNAKDYVRTLP